jgi:hypothetical protein
MALPKCRPGSGTLQEISNLSGVVQAGSAETIQVADAGRQTTPACVPVACRAERVYTGFSRSLCSGPEVRLLEAFAKRMLN